MKTSKPEKFIEGTVGIITNTSKSHAKSATRKVISDLDKNSIVWKLDNATAEYLDINNSGMKFQDLYKSVDWLIVIGGDGTILQAACGAIKHKLPLLGVNPGKSFGFMADTLINDFPEMLDDIRTNNFQILERSTLQSFFVTRKNAEIEFPCALNDITFVQGAHAKLITLEVSINGKFLATISADGLILATATGSTAHSMSAGGPILFPTTDAMILNPVCPHTLSIRPVIVPRGYVLEVKNVNSERDVYIAIDGSVKQELSSKEKIIIKIGEYHVKFIHSKKRLFVDVLREKLHWRGHLEKEK